MKRPVLLAAALLLFLSAGARAAGPQGAAAPHEPNPDAPSDAKSGSTPPEASNPDQQLAQCGEEVKQESQAAGNPAGIAEDAAAHERRVRAVVKLYVAEQMHKTKNGRGCLAQTEAAKQLLAAGEPQPTSGSTQ